MKFRRSHVLKMLAAAPLAAAPAPLLAQVTKIRFGYGTSDGGFEPYWAQDQGFLKKAGIEVELTPVLNNAAMMEAVVGNAMDVCFADAFQMGQAFLRGIPLGIFAGASVYSSDSPTLVMCVAKNSPIKSVKELEGQTLGVITLNGTATIAGQAWLEQNGVDYSKVKAFELPFPQMGPALQRGTVVAATIAEPFLTYARDDVRIIGKPLDVYGKTFTLVYWYAKRDWAANNLDALRRLSNALYETARWANTHQADSLAIMATAQKLDIDRIRPMSRFKWATSFAPRDLQSVLDICYKYKHLDRPVAARDLVISTG